MTQRGNRQQDVFFSDEHRRRYLAWLEHYADSFRLQVIAYCLMNNHIHLVVIPHTADSLSDTLRIVHTRHSQSVNAEFGWSGHLWHGRYYSAPLDDAHVYAAVRYVELNPVRAGIVTQAWEYPWSSAGCHLGLKHEKLIMAKTMWPVPPDEWRKALTIPQDDETVERLRNRTQKGFPCGSDEFVSRIAAESGKSLILRPLGRPKKKGTDTFFP